MTKNQYIQAATANLAERADMTDALEAVAETYFTAHDYAQWNEGKMSRNVSSFLAAVRSEIAPDAYIELHNSQSKRVSIHN